MVERVLDLEKIEIGKSVEFSSHIKYDYVKWYANFLSEPLNIDMFVPAIFVGGKWEVLVEPKKRTDGRTNADWLARLEQYQLAKDKVLFEGFEVEKIDKVIGTFLGVIIFKNKRYVFYPFDNRLSISGDRCYIINDLIKYAPTLTVKGLKDSGLG